ncbi:(ZYRO0F13574g) [Zygosaccharomyces parabailii]|nr:(ZYRO0F13574g) [Zygosaccharomyces parabailii]
MPYSNLSPINITSLSNGEPSNGTLKMSLAEQSGATGSNIKKEDEQEANGIKQISASEKLPDSNNGDATWQKISELNEKRKRIGLQFQEVSHKIKPLEFESYYEFFVINTFKRGISASGHVNIDNLRRHHGKPPKRVKRGSETATREPIASSGSSSSLESDDDLVYNETPASKRQRRAETNESEDANADDSTGASSDNPHANLGPHGAEINGNISVASIIPKLESNRRRSTRLSSKTGDSSQSAQDVQVTEIKDLYESIVPKAKEPIRRSDWMLPPRLRFTPDKQMRTRVVHEKVNLNELVSLGKIQRVLSRFEGGITGVRKKAWNVAT